MTNKIRWGIAATGGIARSFTEALGRVPDAEVVAVASRTQARASEFAAEWSIPHAHGSYDALAADDDVDIVYVATPHSLHCEDAVRYLEAGKHVLCEKPLALSAAQVRTMADAAQRNHRFLMEALWSRFLPSYQALTQTIDDGAIGDLRLVEADFGFRAPFDPEHRLFDPAQGGGALLDLGIYPLHIAFTLLGHPVDVQAVAELGATGVDEQVAMVLRHEHGTLSVLKAACSTSMTCTARVAGTAGHIDVPAFMHCPDHFVVNTMAGQQRVDAPLEGNGLHYQVHEVHHCLRAGLTESPVMPLSESLALATTMDQIRAQVGVRYPGE
ncbi:MAG: Gfo/Idh/MocA family oxidoreductase [Acidimicrobiia bacterium]